jgi:hypothetical protein
MKTMMSELKPYRILVTGARGWTDRAKIAEPLAWETACAYGYSQAPIQVNGMCEDGADWLCFKWARQIAGIPVEEHPADWRKWRSMAGYYRNQEMVDLGADVCIAFLMVCEKAECRHKDPHWTHGTNHCMTAARKAGIPVVEVYA